MRLAPYDYHRFHFPADGLAGETQWIDGNYHSVNPLALKRFPDILHGNRRTVCDLETLQFGKIAYIEVGALNVASIVQTYASGPCIRGREKGFFQFGGFPQYMPRVHQRPVPRSRQFQPIAQPFKELYAQFFFQIFDLSRDGGL